MINDFIKNVCDTLKIPVPNVSYDTSCFLTKTTMAQYNSSENTIFLKKSDKINPDLLFSIAHELRHVWQYQTNEEFFFKSYKSSNLCSSVESFNLQIAEIDANAFAGLVMIEVFHLKPLYQGLSENIKDKIQARMDYIYDTEFTEG
jgi:Zn-dependent peptidase ImmA (M78 family)